MANGKDALLERAKFFRDYVAAVLNLATGSLVLSVTFLHDQNGHLRSTWLLRRCWWLLFMTIFFGVGYNYVLNIYLRHEGERYDTLLKILSFAFHAAFVGAVCYLLRFGLWNIS